MKKLKKLASEGIRIVIGPATSAELKEVKEYADKNEIILISHSSTAPSLNFTDNIFRFVQNDHYQTEAIVKKMWKDGIRLIVPMWRGDVYGNDLHNHTKEMFELNGTVADGIENIIHR